MTDPWPLRSSLELGALSTAVPCACLHVKHVLWEWGLNGLAESAELPAEILELRNFALRRSHLRVPNPEYETLGR